MSVFTETSETDNQQDQGTENGNEGQTNTFMERLVETRGEQWRDPEVLAKGKLEADNYISDLERQLAEMREDLGRQDYSKQLLEQLQNRQPGSTTGQTEVRSNNNNDSGANNEGNTSLDLSEDKLKSLVKQTLSENAQSERVRKNLEAVEQRLEQTFGTEADRVVKSKANELGMNFDKLKEIASDSPEAFFTLIGEAQRPRSMITEGSVRTESVAMQGSKERNFQYYQDLRRTNRSQYYSQSVQQQMMQDRMRLGDKFY